MNVYDFDGTLYKKDSSVEFYKYCLINSKKILKALPVQIFGAICFVLHIYDKKRFKEAFFSFLRYVDNVDKSVEMFWNKEFEGDCIYYYYKSRHDESDVIISASPEFLVVPAARRLGVNVVIASKVDKATGKFLSRNCRGREKVVRFKSVYGDACIKEFYSDTKSDSPMAALAKQAFFIKNGTVCDWALS